MKKPEVKKPDLNDPSVTEFADAFLVMSHTIHNDNEHIGNGISHSLVSICKAFGVAPDKVTKEQAFEVFDRFLYVAAYLYAYAVKNPKEVSSGTDR